MESPLVVFPEAVRGRPSQKHIALCTVWKRHGMNEVARPMPKPTAQVAPYFEVLGAELTVQFLLQFGGAELYLPKNPRGQSDAEPLIGAEKLAALANSKNRSLQRRVPLAKRWIASVLHWQGHSTAHIARTLRVSDVSVKKWLKAATK